MAEEKEEGAVQQEGKSSGNRRVMALLGLFVLMALFIGIVIFVTQGDSATGDLNTAAKVANNNSDDGTSDSADGEKQDDLFSSGRILGSSDAPILIKDFSDFRCPHCRNAAYNLTPQLIEEYVKTGIARLEFIPVVVTNEEGLVGGLGALCAEDQNQFWAYHDILFERQGEVEFNLENATSFAGELGLDLDQFNDCMVSSKYIDQLVQNTDDFTASGATGTPTFMVNDQIVVGGVEFEKIKELVEEKLNN